MSRLAVHNPPDRKNQPLGIGVAESIRPGARAFAPRARSRPAWRTHGHPKFCDSDSKGCRLGAWGRQDTSVPDSTDNTVRCDVARVSDIPPGTSLAVEAGGLDLALCNIDGEFYAVRNECPHQGVPLAGGFLDGHQLTCSLHGWTFDVRDGAWIGTNTHPLGCFRVHVEGDRVLIELPTSK